VDLLRLSLARQTISRGFEPLKRLSSTAMLFWVSRCLLSFSFLVSPEMMLRQINWPEDHVWGELLADIIGEPLLSSPLGLWVLVVLKTIWRLSLEDDST